MEQVFSFLYIVITALSFWVIIMMLFMILISFKGFKKSGKDYADHAPKNKFLILIPAHNEETVISGIIQSMEQQDYPKDLFDYYILADNCTDNTAKIAREMGAKVMEFSKESPDSPTGKPIALQKAFAKLENYQENYDLVMFFDADNLLDSNMLSEVNSQMEDTPEAVATQCYLGAKNKNGIVAAFYYLSFTISNRFVQFAKYRMGLNVGIGGTGFAVRTDYIFKRGGWKAMSLTEDFEFQIETTVDGKRILWNNTAKIYDEKPTNIIACYKQQKRWAQGRWYVAFRNTKALFRSLSQKKISFTEFSSTLIHMYSLVPYFLMSLQLPLTVALLLLQYFGIAISTPFNLGSFFTINPITIAIFLYSFVLLFYVADYLDNGEKFSLSYFFTLVGSVIVSSFVITLANVVGLFKCRNQHTWVKTEHKINTSI